jgi:hypothetical protein
MSHRERGLVMYCSSNGKRRVCVQVILLAIAVCILLVSSASAPSAESREIELKTKIVSATVYGGKAHVTRSGEVDVKTGMYRIVCDDLPKGFIESSLQVEGAGAAAARIIGIDLERREKQKITTPRFTELNEKFKQLKLQYTELKIKQEALKDRKELMSSISRFSLDKAQDQLARETFSVEDWKVLLDFFEGEKMKTDARIESVSRDLKKLYGEMQWVKSELEAMQVDEGSGKSVVVDCEVTSPGKLTFDIAYLVPNANWKPEYTVRYLERDELIELTYNASIWQSTGEGWEDVSVLLSTAQPHIGAAPPELVPYYLTLSGMGGRITGRVADAATGEPLPYANVVIVDTKKGGMSLSDGSYVIIDVPEGSYRVKAMMMGYKPVEWGNVVVHAGRPAVVNFELQEAIVGRTHEIVVEAEMPRVEVGESEAAHRVRGDDYYVRGGRSGEVVQQITPPPVLYMQADVTSSEFAANLQIIKPIDLETGAEPKRSLVVREKIPGRFSLYGVPRISENIFVEGTFTNTLRVPLLAGMSDVYVETVPEGGINPVSNFVGKEGIDPVAEGQDFTLHLGIDQNIKVVHKLDKKEQLSKSGKKTAKTRYHYVITIESFKKETIDVRLVDRIPVSTIKEVKLDDVDILPAPSEQREDGILVWNVNVSPGEKEEIRISYTVEFPGDWPVHYFNLTE